MSKLINIRVTPEELHRICCDQVICIESELADGLGEEDATAEGFGAIVKRWRAYAPRYVAESRNEPASIRRRDETIKEIKADLEEAADLLERLIPQLEAADAVAA